MAKLIDDSQKVVLDMDGVTSLPSIFLNVSFGRLIDEKGFDFIHKLTFLKITKVQADRLKKYIDSYKESKTK